MRVNLVFVRVFVQPCSYHAENRTIIATVVRQLSIKMITVVESRTRMSIGEIVEQARITHSPKLSQQDLALLTGLSRSQIARLELNELKKGVPETWLTRIADALRIEVDFLKNGEMPSIYVPEPRSIAAGNTIADLQDATARHVVSQELVRASYTGIEIQDLAMPDVLLPADIAVFRPAKEKVGLIFAIEDDHGFVHARVLAIESNSLTFKPQNSNYDSFEHGSVKVKGMLVGVYRTTGDEIQIRHAPFGIRP